MEKLCEEILEELTGDSQRDASLALLVNSLKALNLAYEVHPEVDKTNHDLLYYWIENEAKSLLHSSIEEIAERQKAHLARQEALEAWLIHEIKKSKTKEAAAFLLIERKMRGMTEDQKKKIKSLLRKKIAKKGVAPKKVRVPKKIGKAKGVEALIALGYTVEQAEAMSK